MTYQDPSGRQPERWESDPTAYIPPAQGQPQYGQQGQYGQPYGQGQYNQQGQYQRPGQPPINPFGAESNESFGIAGTVLALLGAVVGIVALTSLSWFHVDGASLDFSDLHDHTGSFDGFAVPYFSWLAWTALIITVIAAVGSSFPSPAVRALRIIGVVLGVALAGLSFLAIELNSNGSYWHDFLKNARAGFYLMVVAYVLAAIGAGIGPSKVTTTAYRR